MQIHLHSKQMHSMRSMHNATYCIKLCIHKCDWALSHVTNVKADQYEKIMLDMTTLPFHLRNGLLADFFPPLKMCLFLIQPSPIIDVSGSILMAVAHKRLTCSPCLALAITAAMERSWDVFKMRPRPLPGGSTEMLSYIYWVSNEAAASSAK